MHWGWPTGRWITNPKVAFCCALFISAPSHVFANSIIAGPLVLMGSSISSDPALWVGITMTLCVIVEGAVYLYTGKYRRPFLASAYANTVSFFVGFPLSFLGDIDPTWFLLPTLVSIAVEYWALLPVRRYIMPDNQRVAFMPVLCANVLSNVMIMGLLYISYLKA